MGEDPDKTVLLVVVAAVCLLWIAGWSPQLVPQPVPVDEDSPETVALGEDGPHVWPYTATSPSFRAGVSPINLVFDEDPETVRDLFLGGDSDWERTPADGGTAANATVPAEDPGLVGWRLLGGNDRYVFVVETDQFRADVRGEWRRPTYHLHRGRYFGSQTHLRVYDGSAAGESWTLVQAHSEHWDWFSLTHRVDSVDRPREDLERELIDSGGVERVERSYYDNDEASDADGWATVVTLAVGSLLFVPAFRRRETGVADALRNGSLVAAVDAGSVRASLTGGSGVRIAFAASLTALVLGVRSAGLLAESVGLPFGVVSKVLYAVLVVGVPGVALVGGRALDRTSAFRMAAGGFALGVIVDYALLSVTVLPLALVVHRTLATVAVGVLATGLAEPRGDDPRGTARLLVGAALWLLVLAVPHAGL